MEKYGEAMKAIAKLRKEVDNETKQQLLDKLEKVVSEDWHKAIEEKEKWK